MKKNLLISLLFILNSLSLNAQDIKSVQAYFKLDGTRYLSLLSDNSIWWFASGDKWQEIPKQNLPKKTIKHIDAFVKIGLGSYETRIITVLEDNSIWWYAKEGDWQQVDNSGLPTNLSIKDFKSYVKIGSMGSTESRIILVLEDNTIWWYALGKKWGKVAANGMPENSSIKFLRTYQKIGMMSSETRFVAVLNDNSVWWFAEGNKWKQVEKPNLPSDKNIEQFEIYMKNASALSNVQEGRLITLLEDQSIFWIAANDKSWRQLEHKGLPQNKKINELKTYQKYGGIGSETRLLALLDDNTLWWFAEGKRWTAVPMSGLPLNK